MRRHAGQRALYEAMSRSRSKRKRQGLFERLRPQLAKLRELGAARKKRPVKAPEPAVEKPAPVTLKPPKLADLPEPAPRGPAQTWLKPKPVQINGGCIEISVPYQIGIIIGLGLTLLVMIAFWFGTRVGRLDEGRRDPMGPGTQASVPAAAPGSTQTQPEQPASRPPEPERTDTAGSDGATANPNRDHAIVLAQYRTRTQLEPVEAFFKRHGIATMIVSFAKLREYFASVPHLNEKVIPSGDGYMLLVTGLCENPGTPGTDGYKVIQKVIEVGRLYKDERPQGYESFGPNYFSDAYGMKVK